MARGFVLGLATNLQAIRKQVVQDDHAGVFDVYDVRFAAMVNLIEITLLTARFNRRPKSDSCLP